MYSGKTEDGTEYTFGTSGLLYRSNKLMYDRQTYSLWANLNGEALAGKMAARGLKLKILPMTLTTWGEWRKMHPLTNVLYLDAKEGAKWSYTYEPGLADRARAGVEFPVWQRNKVLADKEEIYGLHIGNASKAYSIKALLREGILNDKIGAVPIVLVTDGKTESIRAYKREGFTFGENLTDHTGRKWYLREDALISNEQKLPRLPGHVSLWFAWFAFFPHTEIFTGSNPQP